MSLRMTDYNGHEIVDLNGAALTVGAAGTSVPGTVVPVNAGLGAGSTITALIANDRRGSFVATAAGTPAAGVIAQVYFAQPYSVVPAAVVVTAVNGTDTTASLTVAPGSVTVAGFTIVSTVPVAAKAYSIQFAVIA